MVAAVAAAVAAAAAVAVDEGGGDGAAVAVQGVHVEVVLQAEHANRLVLFWGAEKNRGN